MLDYQRTVDELRATLDALTADTDDQFRRAVADYALACEEVNERLRRCAALLSQGERSEALRQAEMQPELLAAVATLDIPEAPLLEEEATRLDMVALPRLQVGLAAELNQAYADEQPLDALLREHRLAALERWPLRERITVLRRLLSQEPNHTGWRDDLAAYERERVRQIQGDLRSAQSTTDVVLAEELLEELEESPWSSPPAQPLVYQAKQRVIQIRRRAARAELLRLEPLLNDAFSALDTGQGLRLLAEWERWAELARLDPADDLADRAGPALDWLQSERSKANNAMALGEAETQLGQLLESEASALELEQAFNRANRFGLEVSPALRQRFERRIHTLGLAAQRRHRLQLVGAVGAAIALTVIVWIGVRYRAHAVAVSNAVASVSARMDANDLVGALRMLDELPVGLATEPSLQELESRVNEAMRLEEDRQAEFQLLVERLNRGPRETPDVGTLQQARGLATTVAEKAALARFDAEVARAQQQALAAREEAFQTDLQQFADALMAFESGLETGEVDRRSLTSLGEHSRQLLARSQVVGGALRAQFETVLKPRFDAAVATSLQQEQENERMQQVTTAIGSPAQFAAALELFADVFKNETVAADVRAVAAEQPLWEAMRDWSALAQKWKSSVGLPINPSIADDWYDGVRSWRKDHANFPHGDETDEALDHVSRHLQRFTGLAASGPPIVEDIKRLLLDPLVADLFVVETNRGERFYCSTDISLQAGAGGLAQIKYLSTVRDFFKVQSVFLKPADVTFHGPASQSEWARGLLLELEQLKQSSEEGHWERVMVDASSRILRHSSMDPVLKLLLLKSLLENASRGSRYLEEAFSAATARINESRVSLLSDWFTPAGRDDEVDRNRVMAEGEIKSLEGLLEISSRAVAEAKAAGLKDRTPSLPTLEWVGWLHRNADGTWKCIGHDNPVDDGECIVLKPTGKGDTVELVSIGQIVTGACRLFPSEVSAFAEGRPVWLKRRAGGVTPLATGRPPSTSTPVP